MKKWTFILLLNYVFVSLSFSQTTVFDPSDYADSTLPAGWSVEVIGGDTLMKVIVNGWTSAFMNIPEVANFEGNAIKCTYKYVLGPETDSLTTAEINSYIRLTDTINLTPAPWNENYKVPYAVNMTQNPVNRGFLEITAAIDTSIMEFMHTLMVFGQNTLNWSPTIGDTVWFGKIVTYEEVVLFNPATYPVNLLPSNMEIVDIGGTKLLKINTDGWNNYLTLVTPCNMGINDQLRFSAKIEPASSGEVFSNLRYFIAGENPSDGQEFAKADIAVAGLTEVSVYTGSGFDIKSLQFAVIQKAAPYNAVTNAFYYVGKITAEKALLISEAPRVSQIVPYTKGEEILIDGLQLEDAWLESTKAKADQKISMVEGQIYPTSDADNSANWAAVYDKEFLYIFAEITDDNIIVMTNPNSAYYTWLNDGLELYLDIKDRRYPKIRLDKEQHHLRYNIGRSTADTSSLNPYVGDHAYVSSASSYSLEIAIPWRGICKGVIAPEDIDRFVEDSIVSGKKIAFEISIIDAEPEDNRKSILNWSNNTGEDFSSTSSQYYGQLILRDFTELIITSTPTNAALINIPYTYQLTFEGNGEFSVSSSPDADWLSIDQNGLLSGSPTATGDFDVSILFENDCLQTSQNFTLTVNPYTPINITSKPIEKATSKKLYKYQLTFEGEGVFSLTSTPNADWLTINQKGFLTGTPNDTGNFEITVVLDDTFTRSIQSFTISVSPYVPVKITSSPIESGFIGILYEYQLSFEGEGMFTINSIPIPEWLSIDKNGLLSGTPTEIGDYNISLVLDDSISTAYQSFVISVTEKISSNFSPDMDDIAIYPNPAAKSVIISNALGSSITIYDIVGKKITNYKIDLDMYKINIQSFDRGIYLVYITKDNNQLLKKLLIE